MNKNTGFLQSLGCALSGIAVCVRRERNLRIHISIGNLICVFAYVFGLNRTQWAVLALTIAVVIAAELFNSAAENAVDAAVKEWSEYAGLAKDAAAGAVTVCALGALAVGFALFGDAGRIWAALVNIFTTPYILIPSCALGAADVLFVLFGGIKGAADK